MRSHLTTLLTVGFLSIGTAGALALSGGQGFGLGGSNARSASASQYGGPPFSTPPVSTPGPPVSTPPVATPPVPTPPASKFNPRAASAHVTAHGATVNCAVACHIVLRARRGSHRVRVTKTLGASGTATVSLSKRALRSLGHGRVVVIVEVDGKQVAKRTVKVA